MRIRLPIRRRPAMPGGLPCAMAVSYRRWAQTGTPVSSRTMHRSWKANGCPCPCPHGRRMAFGLLVPAEPETASSRRVTIPMPPGISCNLHVVEEGNVRRFEMTSLFPPYIPAMANRRFTRPTITSTARIWVRSSPKSGEMCGPIPASLPGGNERSVDRRLAGNLRRQSMPKKYLLISPRIFVRRWRRSKGKGCCLLRKGGNCRWSIVNNCNGGSGQ